MSLTPEEKTVFNRIMGQLLAMLDTLDRMPCNPHTIDLIEIAGSLLKQQVEENLAYDPQPDQHQHHHDASDGIIGPSGENMDANETQAIPEDSPLASFAQQASDAEEHVTNGLGNEIIKQGGFLFLNPDAKTSGDAKDIPSSDDLQGWFNI